MLEFKTIYRVVAGYSVLEGQATVNNYGYQRCYQIIALNFMGGLVVPSVNLSIIFQLNPEGSSMYWQ